MRNAFEQLNKALMFYFPSRANYWDTITYCQINDKISEIGRYYLNFKSKYYYPYNFSGDGVPLYKMSSDREIFQPTVICQYALGIYETMYENNFKDKYLQEKFFIQADWLLNNILTLKRGSGWILDFDVPDYNLRSPWISALTQGEAISVLCRAFKLSGKEVYLDTAKDALIPFKYTVLQGGLKSQFKNFPVYEEYPSQEVNVVLNGFIFSLLGIFDLCLVENNPTANELFSEGVNSIANLLQYFDTGIWSKYNLYGYPGNRLASYKYHRLHIEQLKVLYFITSNRVFYDYYNKWEGYDKSFKNRTKALFQKLTDQ